MINTSTTIENRLLIYCIFFFSANEESYNNMLRKNVYDVLDHPPLISSSRYKHKWQISKEKLEKLLSARKLIFILRCLNVIPKK